MTDKAKAAYPRRPSAAKKLREAAKICQKDKRYAEGRKLLHIAACLELGTRSAEELNGW